jgi:hypothetical protein
MKNLKKETVKNGKKNAFLSTQRYLQFASTHDDVLVLKNGGLRAIIEVSSINFNLKSEDEQNAIIHSYQRFLNSLNFPTQILIKSRKLDIDKYLENLKIKKNEIENPLLKNQMGEYIEYISKLVEFTDIMEKKFYVIVPTNPMRAEKVSTISNFMAYIKPDDTVLEIITRRKEFKTLKKDLDNRVNIVKTALENCGLNVTQLSTQKIIEIFYRSYNPQLSRNQKLSPVEGLALSDPPEKNLVSGEI